MLKAFNAFQIVALFSAAPFVIAWLFNHPNKAVCYGLSALGCILYAIFVFVITGVVHDAMD